MLDQGWKYFLERDDGTTEAVIERRSRPTMMKVITHAGKKWRVWYIEEGAGAQNARCEPVAP